jgi:hypothetical protein
MKIEHGVSTGLENSLDEDIVFTQESGVESGGRLIVSYHVLPSEWESEAVISPLATVPQMWKEEEKGRRTNLLLLK